MINETGSSLSSNIPGIISTIQVSSVSARVTSRGQSLPALRKPKFPEPSRYQPNAGDSYVLENTGRLEVYQFQGYFVSYRGYAKQPVATWLE